MLKFCDVLLLVFHNSLRIDQELPVFIVLVLSLITSLDDFVL